MNARFIEKYQLLYQKNPKSKVFAPLIEAYRKLGLLKQAVEIGRQGVKLHPNFVSGRVALAKVLLAQEKTKDAIEQLLIAVELSPENILAQSLLGKSYWKLRQPKEALKAFKMVLFLNPLDLKAKDAVQKLESLTADEFESDVFHLSHLKSILNEERADLSQLDALSQSPDHARHLERFMSLADALIVRNDLDRASKILKQAQAFWGDDPEIGKRLSILTGKATGPHPTTPAVQKQETVEFVDMADIADSALERSTKKDLRETKKQILENLLLRINQQTGSSPTVKS